MIEDQRLRDVIRFLVRFYPRTLFRTTLVKLVYLTDVAFYRKHGRTLTDTVYRHHHYGPYSESIVATADELVTEGLLSVKAGVSSDGDAYFIYNSNEGQPDFDHLDDYGLEALDGVNNSFCRLPLEQLLAHVYSTEPLASSRPGEIIDFGALGPSATAQLPAYARERLRLTSRIIRGRARERLASIARERPSTEYDTEDSQEMLDNARLAAGASLPLMEEE